MKNTGSFEQMKNKYSNLCCDHYAASQLGWMNSPGLGYTCYQH